MLQGFVTHNITSATIWPSSGQILFKKSIFCLHVYCPTKVVTQRSNVSKGYNYILYFTFPAFLYFNVSVSLNVEVTHSFIPLKEYRSIQICHRLYYPGIGQVCFLFILRHTPLNNWEKWYSIAGLTLIS